MWFLALVFCISCPKMRETEDGNVINFFCSSGNAMVQESERDKEDVASIAIFRITKQRNRGGRTLTCKTCKLASGSTSSSSFNTLLASCASSDLAQRLCVHSCSVRACRACSSRLARPEHCRPRCPSRLGRGAEAQDAVTI